MTELEGVITNLVALVWALAATGGEVEAAPAVKYINDALEILRDLVPDPVKGEGGASGYGRCPKCWNLVPRGSRYCSNCGKGLDWGAHG